MQERKRKMCLYWMKAYWKLLPHNSESKHCYKRLVEDNQIFSEKQVTYQFEQTRDIVIQK